MNSNKPFLSPVFKQTLEFVSLGVATSGFIIGIDYVIKELQKQSDKAVFDFAVRNHLGGSLLPVARNLMEFSREQTATHLWHGALIGVAVSSVVFALVVLFLTTGKYSLERDEYISLLDKSTRWDYYLITKSNSTKSNSTNLKGYYDQTKTGSESNGSFSDSHSHY